MSLGYFAVRRYQFAFSHAIEDATPSLHCSTFFRERAIFGRAVRFGHVVLTVEVELSEEEVLQHVSSIP
jgi:hypothetical protein